MIPASNPIKADNARFVCYDIESLQNVFSVCSFDPRTNMVHVMVLSDDIDPDRPGIGWLDAAVGFNADELRRRILLENPAYPGTAADIFIHDLRTCQGNINLARLLGGVSSSVMVNDKTRASVYNPRDVPANDWYNERPHLRPTCDTDRDYDPFTKHPFLLGWNNSYDLTMLAHYLDTVLAYYQTSYEDHDETFEVINPNTGEVTRHTVPASVEVTARNHFAPTTASMMRAYNDRLFNDFHDQMPRALAWGSNENKIYRNMFLTGRHLNVQNFNERQRISALKRQAGGLGFQIKESSSLTGPNSVVNSVEDLYDLITYNVSDVVSTWRVFTNKTYSEGFNLKMSLIQRFPHLVYRQGSGQGKGIHADQRPDAVDKRRLAADSTSAKLVVRSTKPYGRLSDSEVVDFMYPHPDVAAKLGIEPFDVLELVNDTMAKMFPDESYQGRRNFAEVYAFYDWIRGRNFNDSEEYTEDYPEGPEAVLLKDIPARRLYMPYMRADGSMSTCFVNFSIGGIHGAEVNQALYEADLARHQELLADYDEVTALYPDARDLLAACKESAGWIVLPDGQRVLAKEVLTGITSRNLEKLAYKKLPKKASEDHAVALGKLMVTYLDPRDLLALKLDERAFTLPSGRVLDYHSVTSRRTAKDATYFERAELEAKAPQLFVDDARKGGNKLNPKYGMTSCEKVSHQDFSSYYPNLLINMKAFYDESIGVDIYAGFYEDKERFGAMLEDKSLSEGERAVATLARQGVKLLLNSATGAAAALAFSNNIRMNNNILKMRIIGQLFTFLVAQTETFECDARVISTNTDGIYVAVDDDRKQHMLEVLERLDKVINVLIKPEDMILMTKDSNNRLELDFDDTDPTGAKVKKGGASGGSLSCWRGPNPEQALSHPAVVDNMLVEYLRMAATGYTPEGRDRPISLREPADAGVMRSLAERVLSNPDKPWVARMFQNILASAPNGPAYSFAFSVDPANQATVDADDESEALALDVQLAARNPKPLQHYNRVFITRDGTTGGVNMYRATAALVNAKNQASRNARGEQVIKTSDVAMQIMRDNGLTRRRADVLNGSTMIDDDRDVKVAKINGVDPQWSMVVLNDDLFHLPAERMDELLNSLDLDKYAAMACQSFNVNWANQLTGHDVVVSGGAGTASSQDDAE